MTAKDSIDNYQEVASTSFKMANEATGSFVPPSAEFIARAEATGKKDNKRVVVYNTTTGFFELNGLTDITTAQMEGILANGVQYPPYLTAIDSTILRTNLLIDYRFGLVDHSPNMSRLYRGGNLEVVNVGGSEEYPTRASSLDEMLGGTMSKLRKIIGIIEPAQTTPVSIMSSDLKPVLTDIRIKKLKVSLSMRSAPSLSLESIAYMVEHAANTTPITITLHKDAYDRLTDEIVQLASDKDIAFAYPNMTT